jgi:3-hydroxyacyl-CoA dehydrogenase/enoyl-CoA hydratase/3-hydroxybutyryl-CoA epimerase
MIGEDNTMKTNTFSQKIIEDTIILLTFNTPGKRVNIFTPEAMDELETILLSLKKRTDLQALLFISGKENHFTVGADINILAGLTDRETGYQLSRRGQQVFSLFTELPFPAISVINGVCVGGGTELSLACTYRIAGDHQKTRIALPEVTIGIIPGWGGTQRLPRLVGVQRSLDFILSGRRLDAQQAFRLGIIDKVIDADSLLPAAIQFAKKVISGENVLRQSHRQKRTLLDRLPFGKQILYSFAKRRITKQTWGNYPAPQLALTAIREGLKKPIDQGLQIEALYFKQLTDSTVSKNLIRIFFWRNAIKKERVIESADIKPLEISQTAVVGTGVMGGGIAQMLAAREISTCLKGIREKSLERAKQRGVSNSAKIGESIGYTLSYEGFQEYPFIIESIPENLKLKEKIFVDLEKQVTDETIIATNTSSFSICELAKSLQKPQRFIGMHFFNPPRRMPLVEIIRGEHTSDKTLVTTVNLAKQLGKTPVVVKDSPGFVVNRILAPFLLEALLLLKEGIALIKIDSLMKKFGLPAGPFEMFDVIGMDIALAVAKNLAGGHEASDSAITFLGKIVEAGYLGKKTGLGFYCYKKKRKKCNRKIKQYIEYGEKQYPADEEIIQRLIYPMVNEAACCLEEEIVSQVRDIDVAMIFGLGFAPFRGGLLTYADKEGITKIFNVLEGYSEKYGQRFKPCRLLYAMQKEGRNFYS